MDDGESASVKQLNLEELQRKLLELRDENRDLKIKVAGVNVLSSILKTTREDLRVVQQDKDSLEDQLTHVECRCTILERDKLDRVTNTNQKATIEPARKVIETLVEENSRLKAEMDVLKKSKGVTKGQPASSDIFLELHSFKDQIELEVERLQKCMKGEQGLQFDKNPKPYDSHLMPFVNTTEGESKLTKTDSMEKELARAKINNQKPPTEIEIDIDDDPFKKNAFLNNNDEECEKVDHLAFDKMKELLRKRDEQIKMLGKENEEMVALNCALLEQVGGSMQDGVQEGLSDNRKASNKVSQEPPCIQGKFAAKDKQARGFCPTILEVEEMETQTADLQETHMGIKEQLEENRRQYNESIERKARHNRVMKEKTKAVKSIAVMTDMTGLAVERMKLQINLLQFDVDSEKNKVSDLQWQLDELQMAINEQPAMTDPNAKSTQKKKSNEKSLSKSVNCISTLQRSRTTRRIVLETEI